MLVEKHICEFEAFEIEKISNCAQKQNVSDMAEDLIFCTICGKEPRIVGVLR